MAGHGDKSRRIKSGLPGRILPSDYLGLSRRAGTAGRSDLGRQASTAHIALR
jgi:hypothetical protein